MGGLYFPGNILAQNKGKIEISLHTQALLGYLEPAI